MQHDYRHDYSVPDFVRQADELILEHRRMLQHHVLDFPGGDVFARAFDHIFLAVDETIISILVLNRVIAGVQPGIADGSVSNLGIFEIPRHKGFAESAFLDAHSATLQVGRRPAGGARCRDAPSNPLQDAMSIKRETARSLFLWIRFCKAGIKPENFPG